VHDVGGLATSVASEGGVPARAGDAAGGEDLELLAVAAAGTELRLQPPGLSPVGTSSHPAVWVLVEWVGGLATASSVSPVPRLPCRPAGWLDWHNRHLRKRLAAVTKDEPVH
jgi:hypothetical protein